LQVVLKKTNPASQAELDERTESGKSAHLLKKKGELVLMKGCQESFRLGIRTNASSQDHFCQGRRLLKMPEEGIQARMGFPPSSAVTDASRFVADRVLEGADYVTTP
jgi:hypothetical protein